MPIDTTVSKCYREMFNQTRPSKKHINDVIINTYIMTFLVVCLRFNENEFFKEMVKYYRETYLTDKMIKSIK